MQKTFPLWRNRVGLCALAKQVIPWMLSLAATFAVFLLFSKHPIATILSASDFRLAIQTTTLQSSSPIFLILFVLMGVAFASLFKASRAAIGWAFVFGAFLGFLNTLGGYVSFFGGLEAVFVGRWRWVYGALFALEWLGTTVLFAGLCLCVSRLFDAHPLVRDTKPLCSRRAFLVYFSALICVWTLWMMAYGLPMPYDTRMQLTQGLFLEPLNDHHPVLMSIVLGRVAALGKWLFGSYYAGVCLFGAVQMAFMAAVLAYVLVCLRKWGVNSICVGVVLVYFLLHPFFAIYSFSPLKDVWLSCLVLLYIVAATDRAFQHPSTPFSWRSAALWAVLLTGIIFAKKTGLIMVVMAFPFVWILFWGGRWKFLAAHVLAIGIFLAVQGPVFAYFNVEKGGIQETLSIPLQQVARTLKCHYDGVLPEEIATLNAIVPAETLGSLYKEEISDPVKARLNNEAFLANAPKYAQLWGEIGLRYPWTYVDATLHNTMGYWYANIFWGSIMHDSYFDLERRFIDEKRFTFDDDAIAKAGKVPQTFLMAHLYQAIYALKLIPLASLVTSIGFFFYAGGVSAYLLLIRRKYRLLAPYAIIFAAWAMCMVSPVFAEVRYAYIVFLALPICWCVSFLKRDCGFKE